MISLLLFKQIAQLFLAMLVGFCLVRCGLLKPKDSRVLSVVALYAALPCVIIESFQMDCTPEMVQGLLLALLSAVLIHLVMFLLVYLLRRPLRLHPVEQASVVYSNANNLIIPIVSA
ncbi:MAG: AEC family transporter, partial [Oscillospiraceae bacterium]|nr:AEC family transporter [Oscillospiraceae bacterium]